MFKRIRTGAILAGALMMSVVSAGPAFAHGHGGHIDVSDTAYGAAHAAYWVGSATHDGSEYVVNEGWERGSGFCPVIDVHLSRHFPASTEIGPIPVGLCLVPFLANYYLGWLP